MWIADFRKIRAALGLSRAEFARFLGVSEPTVVRWESNKATSEPRGLQALMLQALQDAMVQRPPKEIARVVRSCMLDHRVAVRTLLDAAG